MPILEYVCHACGNGFEKLIRSMMALFEEADIVVAHNGDKFDIKWIMGRALLLGMPPPAPFRTVDTLKICRSRFRLTSYLNSLLHNSLIVVI